jgi:GTPase Era involved in 16S rRNA processing
MWKPFDLPNKIFKRVGKVTNHSPSSTSVRNDLTTHATLIQNFNRLNNDLQLSNQRSIAVFGQPGAGKSSLIHKITNGNCEPKPMIGQQTDATDWSINPLVDLLHDSGESIFIDTPGYGTAKHPLSSYLSHFPFSSIDNYFFVIKGKIHQADQEMFQYLTRLAAPYSNIVLIRSFSDDLTDEEMFQVKRDLFAKLRYKYHNIPLVFLSNRTGDGLSELQEYI